MTITKDEVKKILSNVKDGDKILSYIEELEERLENHYNCDCGNEDYEDDEDEDKEWKEIKTNYESKISVSEWENLLKDPQVFNRDALTVLKRMRHVAAPTNSSELANMFGCGVLYYSLEIDKAANKIIKKLDLKNVDEDKPWVVLLKGWKPTKLYKSKIYALLPELYEAIGNVDLSDIPLTQNN